VVAYLGKDPYDKLAAMLREGKITIAEVAQINYREIPLGYQEQMTYALVMECKGAPWAKVSLLAKIGVKNQGAEIYGTCGYSKDRGLRLGRRSEVMKPKA